MRNFAQSTHKIASDSQKVKQQKKIGKLNRATRRIVDYYRGFTLIEILIVVSLIGIIATLSIPNLLRSRMSANEVAVIGAMKALASGQVNYNSDRKPHSYAATLLELGTALDTGGIPYIDPSLTEGIRNGYTFRMTQDYCESATESGTIIWPCFAVQAVPLAYSNTGIRSFFVDESGVVRGENLNGTWGGPEMNALD